MSRKSRRRRPKKHDRPMADPAPTTTSMAPLTEVEEQRLRQRFARMTGRSISLSFVAIGPEVEAASPEELVERTDAIVVALARRQIPS